MCHVGNRLKRDTSGDRLQLYVVTRKTAVAGCTPRPKLIAVKGTWCSCFTAVAADLYISVVGLQDHVTGIFHIRFEMRIHTESCETCNVDLAEKARMTSMCIQDHDLFGQPHNMCGKCPPHMFPPSAPIKGYRLGLRCAVDKRVMGVCYAVLSVPAASMFKMVAMTSFSRASLPLRGNNCDHSESAKKS